MSDIQAGDVVVSIPEDLCPFSDLHLTGPEDPSLPSGIYGRVLSVTFSVYGVPILRLKGHASAEWCAGCFRKLNDGTGDAELIARIRKCKPARQPIEDREHA